MHSFSATQLNFDNKNDNNNENEYVVDDDTNDYLMFNLNIFDVLYAFAMLHIYVELCECDLHACFLLHRFITCFISNKQN